MSFRPTLWPTVFTVPAVLLMLGLGVWQIQRLHWKEGLIAERVERTTAPAIALPGPNDDISAAEFRHVGLTGEFLHDKELFLGARSLNDNTGYHVVTPFRLADNRGVLVDCGGVRLDHA